MSDCVLKAAGIAERAGDLLISLLAHLLEAVRDCAIHGEGAIGVSAVLSQDFAGHLDAVAEDHECEHERVLRRIATQLFDEVWRHQGHVIAGNTGVVVGELVLSSVGEAVPNRPDVLGEGHHRRRDDAERAGDRHSISDRSERLHRGFAVHREQARGLSVNLVLDRGPAADHKPERVALADERIPVLLAERRHRQETTA